MALTIQSLNYTYPGGNQILRDITLTVDIGERVAILGANGSGKSTLGRLMSAARVPEPPTGFRWHGRLIAEMPMAERVGLVQYVGQRPDLQISGRGATVREEVAFGPENLCLPPHEIQERVASALRLMGLQALAYRDCRTLSGGETQRLALAAALAMRPSLLVLDEPATDIDAASASALSDVLRAQPWPMTTILLDVDANRILAPAITRWCSLSDRKLTPIASPSMHTISHRSRQIVPSDTTPPPALAMEHVCFDRSDGTRVLANIDIALPTGSITALTGANGAGKSTLLRLVAGLETPTQGTIRLAGELLDVADRRKLSRRVGFVFQSSDRHFVGTRVLDEVAFSARLLKLPNAQDLAYAAMDRMGLRSLAGVHPLDLDAGTRRLVSLAAAIAHRPPVLLLDEVLRGLDQTHLDRLTTTLADEAGRGATILIATHDLEFTERFADSTIKLENGKAVRV